MIQPRGGTAQAGLLDRLATVLAVRAALLRTEWALGSTALVCLSLSLCAMGLQTVGMLSPGHFRPAPNIGFAVLVSGSTLGSLVVALVLGLRLRRILPLPARRAIIILGLALTCVLGFMGAQNVYSGISVVQAGLPYDNDGAVMDLYAANQVVDGHNPYVKTNIIHALAAINAPCTTTTPLMDGQFRGATAYPSAAEVQQVCNNALRLRPRTTPPEFESKYNYPSGSFLFILPFVLLGMHDMRFLYALALIGMGLYIAWRLPRKLRFLAFPLLLADVPVIKLTAGGQPDTIYGLFLLLAYAEWDTPWLSPIMMGLAIGTKQLAWFFVPFYLLLVLRTLGMREVARRTAILGAVFAVLNLPFILLSPSAYFTGVAGPMTDPMFPLGIGVIALFVSNVLPMLPKVAFTLAELGAWSTSFLVNARLRMLPAVSGIVFGVVPLFFAWRSLTNYFYLVPLLATAVVLADAGRRRATQRT